MIVCHCNALREAQVRAAARDGEDCVETVYARLGCRVECGGCVPYAELLLREDARELMAA